MRCQTGKTPLITMLEAALTATLLLFILLVATSTVTAQAQPKAYCLGHPFELEDLPFGTIRDRLVIAACPGTQSCHGMVAPVYLS